MKDHICSCLSLHRFSSWNQTKCPINVASLHRARLRKTSFKGFFEQTDWASDMCPGSYVTARHIFFWLSATSTEILANCQKLTCSSKIHEDETFKVGEHGLRTVGASGKQQNRRRKLSKVCKEVDTATLSHQWTFSRQLPISVKRRCESGKHWTKQNSKKNQLAWRMVEETIESEPNFLKPTQNELVSCYSISSYFRVNFSFRDHASINSRLFCLYV